ncbi:MAG TPA: hypothetical protein VNO52_10940 [Methylomirabilota bacterium]|nr:hypothetical protein [Methylomirabilota bacterium]
MVVAHDGQEYLLEAADEFEREVAQLGQSERFMQLLTERRKEEGRLSLEGVEKRLKPLETD